MKVLPQVNSETEDNQAQAVTTRACLLYEVIYIKKEFFYTEYLEKQLNLPTLFYVTKNS